MLANIVSNIVDTGGAIFDGLAGIINNIQQSGSAATSESVNSGPATVNNQAQQRNFWIMAGLSFIGIVIGVIAIARK